MKAKKRARHVLHPLALGLHTRSIANVVSKLFQRILSKKLFAQKSKIGFRNAIAASRARKLRNVRDRPLDNWASRDRFGV